MKTNNSSNTANNPKTGSANNPGGTSSNTISLNSSFSANGSNIFDLINEMENYVNDCSSLPLQPNKIVVQGDTLNDFITRLKLALPEEIAKATAIVKENETIVSTTKERLTKIEESALKKANAMIEESEITRQSREKAAQVLESAYKESEDIRKDAYSYTDELLEKVESSVNSLLTETTSNFERFEKILQVQLGIISENRNSLKE